MLNVSIEKEKSGQVKWTTSKMYNYLLIHRSENLCAWCVCSRFQFSKNIIFNATTRNIMTKSSPQRELRKDKTHELLAGLRKQQSVFTRSWLNLSDLSEIWAARWSRNSGNLLHFPLHKRFSINRCCSISVRGVDQTLTITKVLQF